MRLRDPAARKIDPVEATVIVLLCVETPDPIRFPICVSPAFGHCDHVRWMVK